MFHECFHKIVVYILSFLKRRVIIAIYSILKNEYIQVIPENMDYNIIIHNITDLKLSQAHRKRNIVSKESNSTDFQYRAFLLSSHELLKNSHWEISRH